MHTDESRLYMKPGADFAANETVTHSHCARWMGKYDARERHIQSRLNEFFEAMFGFLRAILVVIIHLSRAL
jgi:hypothetical protein